MAQGEELAPDSAAPAGSAPLEDWPLRPWILAGLLAAAGLLIHFLFDGNDPQPLEAAGIAFLFFGSMSAAFALGPKRIIETAVFALLAGSVMGGLAWHTAQVQDSDAGVGFAFAAGVFASVLALPLFQAQFHRTRFATDYKLTHFHVWTDAVSAGGALVFTGLSWLLLLLLDQLLGLVSIDIIGDLMGKAWFGWMWSGAAFGAALGVLRNNLKIIGGLQNVVLIVLSLLAVPLALGLAVFLIALLASGGSALWDATDAATPILLACAVGCFVLANSIIREDEEALGRNLALKIAALVLVAGILPLTAFSAVSMGIRINQYGLSPERIWALVCIVVACAYGVAYWAGLARGRWTGWAARLRQANLHLAAGTCILALILALPIVDFGGISARSQIARLESGRVSPEEFDFAALRWDFGDAGRAALDRLAQGEGQLAQLATAALAQTERPYGRGNRPEMQRQFTGTLRVQPADPALQRQLVTFLQSNPGLCDDICVALDLGLNADGTRGIALVNGYRSARLIIAGGEVTLAAEGQEARDHPTFDANSKVEIREETRRFVFVNGEQVGEPLD